MLPVAIGSEGGGSTRLPSSLCGVIGLHPTTGRVPNATYGSARLMLTSTFGPIARDSAMIIAQSRIADEWFASLGATLPRPEIALEDLWPHVASTMHHYEGDPIRSRPWKPR